MRRDGILGVLDLAVQKNEVVAVAGTLQGFMSGPRFRVVMGVFVLLRNPIGVLSVCRLLTRRMGGWLLVETLEALRAGRLQEHV